MPATKSTADAALDYLSESFDAEAFANLHARWMDEKEYEPWSDYSKAIREMFSADEFRIVNITKGFRVDLVSRRFPWYILRISSTRSGLTLRAMVPQG